MRLMFVSASLFVIWIGTLLTPVIANARILNQRELLARCYTGLTGLRLPSNDPLYQQLATRSATEICVGVLNNVKFDADGKLTNPNDPRARAVLKQFHDFHRSWFDRKMIGASDFNDSLWGTLDISDPAQASYYVTRAFFSDGLHYSSALRGTDNLMAIRDESTATTAGSTSGVVRASRIYFGGYDGAGSQVLPSRVNEPVLGFVTTVTNFENLSFIQVPQTQVGQLIGIHPVQGANTLPSLITKAVGLGGTLNDQGLAVPLNVNENFGAGAMGSQAFLLMNFGHGLDYNTNGTTKLPRRWVDNTFKSFLCRQGPYLRFNDIGTFKRPNADGPFRHSESCLRCHSALDQSALTARNLVLGSTSTFINSHNRIAAVIGKFIVSAGPEQGQEFWPSRAAASFKYQAPQGRLFFRSISGALIDQSVNNLNELGTALSGTDDYFACAAARYVSQFTGVQIGLYDPGDPDNATAEQSLNDHDREWRSFVLALGQELKAGGSLKNLVTRILQSDYYKQSDFGK